MCLPLLAAIPAISTLAIGATTAASVAGAGIAAYGQYQAGQSQKKMYNYEAQSQALQANYDLSVGEAQAENIENVGSEEMRSLVQKQAQTEGSQKAAEGASGTAGSVTAENIATSTFTKEQLDQRMLRYNTDIKAWSANTQAEGEAWGANVTSAQDRIAGKNAAIGANYNAAGTLLGGATSIANTALRIQ